MTTYLFNSTEKMPSVRIHVGTAFTSAVAAILQVKFHWTITAGITWNGLFCSKLLMM